MKIGISSFRTAACNGSPAPIVFGAFLRAFQKQEDRNRWASSSKALGAAALGAVLLVALPRTEAAEFKLSIGAGHPAASAWIATIKDYYVPRVTERVRKETGHTLAWTKAWGGSVCKLGECLEAVESGLLDVGEMQTPFEPAKLMAHNFTYFVPFGTPDPRVAAKAILGSVRQDARAQDSARTALQAGVSRRRHGGQLRAGDHVQVEGHRRAEGAQDRRGRAEPAVDAGPGVTGVQSNLNEAYTSFQTGVYDGWVMFPDAIVSFKLTEVTKQYVDMDFGSIHTVLLTMNQKTWKSLPANVQKIILEAAGTGTRISAR